jgi:uncharacterized phage infection (PIP) family protein YhgE
MNDGADMIYLASSDFAKSSTTVAATMATANQSTNILKSAAVDLLNVSQQVNSASQTFESTADAVTNTLAELRTIVQTAKRDATMTTELVGRLEKAASTLAQAKIQADDYLKHVSDVLIKAHESFADAMARSLREGNRAWQAELSSAVLLLSGAIKNLGDTIDDIPVRK